MEGLRLRNVQKEIFSKLIEIFGEKKIQSIAYQFRLTPREIIYRIQESGICQPEAIEHIDKGTIYNIITRGRGRPKSHFSEAILANSSQINHSARVKKANSGKFPRARKGGKKILIRPNTQIFDPELRSTAIDES